jgi:hypothetical protein
MRITTDMNAGDIVPIACIETLPHDTISIDFNYINRLLSASIVPVMGEMQKDIYVFHVPHRVVNESWRNVVGENTSGFWSAPEVCLAPLVKDTLGSIQIPPGSVADYYDLPTQLPIPKVVLSQMNDLVFRGYLACYNEYFRDQNYQPPIPLSRLNIYNGFLDTPGSILSDSVPANSVADGSNPSGAIVKALTGPGSSNLDSLEVVRTTTWSALSKPLKACKLHDPFTSVLPSPQKGPEVVFSTSGELPVQFSLGDTLSFIDSDHPELNLKLSGVGSYVGDNKILYSASDSTVKTGNFGSSVSPGTSSNVNSWNVEGLVNLSDSVGITINELRTAIATQQVLEMLARGGSRYWSFLKSFFNIEVENPFPDIPTQIGHYRSNLEMYQVAQTSATTEDSPQGSLAGFGYSTTGGGLFTKTFLEHGFIHIFAVIRHKSVYPAYTPPHLFRRNTLDFYLPQLANIGEQPVRLATLNPFREDSMELAIGYQEAWYEYRYDVDRVHGKLRSGLGNSLDVWHFGNYFDGDFTHVNGDWLVSDSQEILDRTLRVTSAEAPQFICQFDFKIDKQRPLPVYSVPGLDTI